MPPEPQSDRLLSDRLLRAVTTSAALVVLAGVLGAHGCAAQSTERVQAEPQDVAGSRTTAIVRATARVAPAVVSVNVLRTRQVRPRSAWDRRYLPPGAQQRSAGFGSGVIVSSAGIVITNDHVITGASRIQVTLPGGRDVDAELIGWLGVSRSVNWTVCYVPISPILIPRD